MKKTILLILLLQGLFARAQHDYVPMAVEGAQWMSQAYNTDYYNAQSYIYGFEVRGDTIINNVDYKKVYRKRYGTGGSYTAGLPVAYDGNLSVVGAIRDDIPNKKVYAIIFDRGGNPPMGVPNEFGCLNYDQEFCLYDFSLQGGDEYIMDVYCIFSIGGGAYIWETNNQYIYGQERIVQHLYNSTFYEQVYEGIGSSRGPFQWMAAFVECYDSPGCVDLLYYCVGRDCMEQDGLVYNVNAIDDNLLSFPVSIYPNPVTNSFVINTQNFKEAKLYTILGKEILTSTTVEIDISKLNKGMYILQIKNTLNQISTKKIVKL